MIYEIQSKSDFLTGATFVVKIPEEDLDRKALYTIHADRPEFILPFRTRCIDRQVEFAYQPGANSRLQYLSGERSPREYAALWTGIFSPLLNCKDWFMNPYSLVLSAEYLFIDKTTKIVRFIYIPSIRGSSDYTGLKEMSASVSRLISSTDAELENKVLRAIMKDINPNDFLRMLKSYSDITPTVMAYPAVAGGYENHPPAITHGLTAPPEESTTSAKSDNSPAQPKSAPSNASDMYQRSAAMDIGNNKPQENAQAVPGDIVINIPVDSKAAKKAKKSIKDEQRANGKKEKKHKKAAGFGIFDIQSDEPQTADLSSRTPPFSEHESSKHDNHMIFEPSSIDDTTQSVSDVENGARFRYIGNLNLPPHIGVDIAEGEIFTIGRFDAAVGKQQSSFEFDKKTKAVSRRHAVIDRDVEGYSIIDLSSSACTFINGQKLPPNTPRKLENGYRVSFGNAGADYVWEDI